MDLTNFLSIYGTPTIKECPTCNGQGCDVCHGFGFLAYANNSTVFYTFKYPLYIALKKRDDALFLRNILLSTLSTIALIAVIISYIINILHSNG